MIPCNCARNGPNVDSGSGPRLGPMGANGRSIANHIGKPSHGPFVRRHFPPGSTYFSSHANTSLCQNAPFFGFATQWPSSGKLIIRLGTRRRCSAENSSCPWPIGQRKSRSLWITDTQAADALFVYIGQ